MKRFSSKPPGDGIKCVELQDAGRRDALRLGLGCMALLPLAMSAHGAGKPPGDPVLTWTMGGNVAVVDWAPSAFVDVVKSSRGFGLLGSFDEDLSGALPRDARGWPTQASQIVITAVGERPGTEWATGIWKGRFRGAGRLVGVEADATSLPGSTGSLITGGSIQNVVRVGDLVTFEWVVTETPMLILEFDAGIADLQIVRPGFDLDAHPLLHPQALDYYKRFHTLRFLDFMGQNDSDAASEANWARRQVAGKWHGRKSWEAMAAFFSACYNASGSKVKGVWWNVPYRFAESDCLQLGKLLKPLLPRAALKFPEFSNELWNSGYSWKWQHFLSRATNTADPDYALVNTPATDQWVRIARLWALQTARMARAMKSAFAQEFNATLFPVMAGQFWRIEFSTQPALEWLALSPQSSQFKGAPKTYIGTLAAAPFLQGEEDMHTETDPIRMIDGLRAGYTFSLANAIPKAALWKSEQLKYGLKRMDAYEWQLHTDGQRNVEVKLAANLADAAGTLLIDQAHAMRDAGFMTMCFLYVSPQTVGYVGKRDAQGNFVLDANGNVVLEPNVNTFAWPLNTSFGGPRSAKGLAMEALIVETRQ